MAPVLLEPEIWVGAVDRKGEEMLANRRSCNSLSDRLGRILPRWSAVVSLVLLSSCGDSEPASSGILQGERSGQRGAPCVTFMDCVAELECVDGRCGIFGEAVQPREPGTCPPGPEPGPGAGSGTGPGSGPGPQPGSSSGGGGSTTSTTTTTTTTTTTSTTGGGGGGGDGTPDKTGEIIPGCEQIAKKYHLKNPYTPANADKVSAGEALYNTPPKGGSSCAMGSCHGESGMGGAASALDTPEAKAIPDCVLLEAIMEGVTAEIKGKKKTVMEAYKDKMTTEEAWQIITYLRSL